MCINTLISYQKSVNEESSIDNLVNCSQSFHLEDAEVRDKEEIETLNIILSKALDS